MRSDSHENVATLDSIWLSCVVEEALSAAAQSLGPCATLTEVVRVLESLSRRGVPLDQFRVNALVEPLRDRSAPPRRTPEPVSPSFAAHEGRAAISPRCEELVRRKLSAASGGRTCAELNAMLRLNGELVDDGELARHLQIMRKRGIVEQLEESSVWRLRIVEQPNAEPLHASENLLRHRHMDAATYDRTLQSLTTLGFDLTKLNSTQQPRSD